MRGWGRVMIEVKFGDVRQDGSASVTRVPLRSRSWNWKCTRTFCGVGGLGNLISRAGIMPFAWTEEFGEWGPALSLFSSV